MAPKRKTVLYLLLKKKNDCISGFSRQRTCFAVVCNWKGIQQISYLWLYYTFLLLGDIWFLRMSDDTVLTVDGSTLCSKYYTFWIHYLWWKRKLFRNLGFYLYEIKSFNNSSIKSFMNFAKKRKLTLVFFKVTKMPSMLIHM